MIMICHCCVQRGLARLALPSVTKPSSLPFRNCIAVPPKPSHHTLYLRRRFTTTIPRTQAEAISIQAATQSKPRQAPTATHEGPSSATSTSAAQPFSTPLSPSPAAEGITSTPIPRPSSKPSVTPLPVSSVPAGAQLKGLGFLKGKGEPIAKEEVEYPAWLWGVLEKVGKVEGGAAGEDVGDLFSKSKKQRRAAAKRLRKQAILHPESLAPKIPIQEQSIDLPYNIDGTLDSGREAQDSREDLTRAMRGGRRKDIKEANFLKGMR
ncbi:MAG: hypothetical protein M1827_007089 [Pycnora praestabilis]|nr:MAG: hypothetical protein M1827_007089 [Pycnora praestabilis]